MTRRLPQLRQRARNLLRILRSWLSPTPDVEIPRTQGVGTWRFAEAYLNAAKMQPAAPTASFVSYFLYGHGLELTLKAFLVSQGSTNTRLKRIGHDLTRALRAAGKHQTFGRVPITDRDRTIIAWLNSYYRDKEFEYLVTGFKSFPAVDEVRDVCERMLGNVKPLIREAVNAHLTLGAANP